MAAKLVDKTSLSGAPKLRASTGFRKRSQHPSQQPDVSQGVKVGPGARQLEAWSKALPKLPGASRRSRAGSRLGTVAARLRAGIGRSRGPLAPYRVEHHVVELDSAGRGEDAGAHVRLLPNPSRRDYVDIARPGSCHGGGGCVGPSSNPSPSAADWPEARLEDGEPSNRDAAHGVSSRGRLQKPKGGNGRCNT